MAATRVQSKTGTTSPGATLNITLDSNVTAGNLLTAQVSVYNSLNTAICTVTGGGTWTTHVTAQNSANSVHIASAENATGGATTVTITITGSIGDRYVTAVVEEWSGVPTTGVFDVSASNTGTGTSVTTGTTAAKAQNNELVLALVGCAGDNAAVMTGFSTSYLLNNSASFQPIGAGYKSVNASGTESASVTLGGSEDWAAAIATFKETSGGGAFDLEAGAIAVDGSMAIAGDIQAQAAQAFDLVTSGAVAMTGAMSVAGELGYSIPWEIEPPLILAEITGVLSISGDLQFVTSGVFNLQPTGPVAMTGALQTIGDLQFVTPIVFDLAQTADVAMVGSVAALGDVQALVSFDLAVEQPVALLGTMSIAGDVHSVISMPFNLTASAPVAMTGTVAAAGDIGFGTTFDLSAGAVAMSGLMGITGALQIRIPATVPDVTGLDRSVAEAALAADGFVASVALALSTSVPVDRVISQSPAAGTASFVGAAVDLVVSQYDVPKIIGGNKNVRFKPVKKRKPEREPVEAKARKASGLLMGLLARAAAPTEPVLLAPGLDMEPIQGDVALPAPAVTEVPPLSSDPVEKQEVPAAQAVPESVLLERLDVLTRMVSELGEQLRELRGNMTPPQPMAALRDPLDDALVAILPAVREPLQLDRLEQQDEVAGLPELDDDERRELGGEPAAPAPALDIEAENRRRAEALARAML